MSGHELAVTLRRIARVTALRLAGKLPPGKLAPAAEQGLSDSLWGALEPAEGGPIAERWTFDVPANRPPWFETGVTARKGERFTWFASGRVILSGLLDIWVGPHFQLWGRIGDGPVFRGTRATHTFTAEHDGSLELASYFPGEWADPSGHLATPAEEYRGISGNTSVVLVRWNAEPLEGLRALDSDHPLVALEIDRIEKPVRRPNGWQYLWFLGDSEIFTDGEGEGGVPEIRCDTRSDVGILRKEVDVPLDPSTELSWSWKVDALPSEIAEDTLPTHDYLSIALEFENGIDLTYYWSAELPEETGYWCPLPTWKDREYHVAVRSGARSLGEWLDERRNVRADYEKYVGAPPSKIVRVWFIANSMFQRQAGRCSYRAIRLRGDHGETAVL